ncbi:regulatory protein RecX [Hoyosella sp. G463]|uniref:Regulatory protein RecX n=1 Tax=Lolliginicoccus lacisalsi TaxID=2742202 RepID=A0A927PLH8_9ACTN|nr:regulatory protein RecX [Lolliginicoccus lacisalsi]MBD8505416.1 regulatory protein RecX [Lolliginicoccus lacisalsi]
MSPRAEEQERSPEEWQAHAKSLCLRWLAMRAHTRDELRTKLESKGIPTPISDAVLERFAEVKLIDDAEFAQAWVRSRHQYAGKGKRAIANELRRKGVDDEDAQHALGTISDDDERDRARELVDKRLRASAPVDWSDPREKQRAIQRLVGMLARRGYGPSISYNVVTEALPLHGGTSDGLLDEPY